MNPFSVPAAYRLVNESPLREIGLTGTVLEHTASGAHLICLPTEDDHKVFFIAFRTPPADDTGVPHILEHSVLCGSDRYPIKDPFMELGKSSLNTFLNAFTYPDKTVYPVASCNDKDFANLMDVYMDAVLHPLIHRNRNIFLQEGWRYELEDPEADLNLNGVVYSEMKGAFSSSEECLARYSLNSLFPDTPYGFESGGDPAAIPSLTYEVFCAFHKKLYHPSNSYIFLYGNMDMTERLTYLDREYLSHYTRANIDSALPTQAPFAARRDFTYTYPLGEDESEEEKTFYAMQWVVGDVEDSRLSNAFDVLETVLLNAPGAPLKQALLDAGFAKDAGGGYTADQKQPVFNITAKGCRAGEKQRFLQIINSRLEELASNGLDPRSIRAAISSREFQRREADYGGMSKGLIYGLSILQTWLHGGRDPFLYLRFENDFSYLRDHISDGYFEGLIRRYLLDNPHCSLVEMVPERGKDEKDAAALHEKLQAYKASLSEEQKEALVGECRALKAYQEAEDSPEACACVPKLKLSDIPRPARTARNHETAAGPARLISRFDRTAGIAYVGLYFNLMNVPREHLPWLGLLKACLTVVSTEKRGYRELFDLISETTGGISLTTDSFRVLNGDWTPYCMLSVRALTEKWQETAALIKEICLSSRFDDEKRLQEILAETLLALKQNYVAVGHRAAASRAASYYNEPSLFSELTGGLDFLRFLEDLSDHFEERKQEIADTLKAAAAEVFTRDGMIINLTCEEETFPLMQPLLADLAEAFPSDPERRFSVGTPVRRNEGIRTTAAVGFVAHCGSYRAAGPYRGSLKVLQNILSMDYLWQQLRVLGGAYGAMCQFSLHGPSYFVSYRDPHIRNTEEVYRRIPAYLESLDLPQETLESFIISTIGGMDFPYSPSVRGSIDLSLYLSGITPALQQRERDEVLDCTVDDLKALAPYMEAILQGNNICAVGSGVKIDEDKDLFDRLINL